MELLPNDYLKWCEDLQKKFPDDRVFSERNIGYMKQFALAYPDFPILQVPLAKIGNLPIAQETLAEFQDSQFLQVPLALRLGY